LSAIYQTFDRKEVYPTIEEKAAHLLYFVVKNHSFTGGNKRIEPFCLYGSWNETIYYTSAVKK
jgi:prophage maintenance system killer protein